MLIWFLCGLKTERLVDFFVRLSQELTPSQRNEIRKVFEDRDARLKSVAKEFKIKIVTSIPKGVKPVPQQYSFKKQLTCYLHNVGGMKTKVDKLREGILMTYLLLKHGQISCLPNRRW